MHPHPVPRATTHPATFMSGRFRHGAAAWRDRDMRFMALWWRACMALLAMLVLLALTGAARAQEPGLPPGILASGDGVITGFSGHVENDKGRYINPDGISAKILPLPSRPLAGQLANPAPKLEITASRIGQVFGVALDSFPNPNVYLGATSAYGLHIVADTDNDGVPEPITMGRPGAQWMEGQFGPGGGPGTIWRVDGTTGEITPFATIPDTVAGIGNLAVDPVHFQLFASDLDSGLIYRIDLAGNIIDTYDHGTTGRQHAGLPPVADDGKVANIESPDFDVNNANTWGLTDTRRRVWGLAYHRGRLYYAVADGPQIWSVGINLDGSFANDARLEILRVPGGMPVSDILFTPQGWMIVAQRGFRNGDSTFVNFHIKGANQVIRYRRDPRTGQWTQVPEPYAVGLTPDHTYAAGGIGLSCAGVLWSTGDNLRSDPLLLAADGAPQPVVHGLQGNDVRHVRPLNTPPFNSIFIDYDGRLDNPDNAGHVGDVEVYRDCRGAPAQPGMPALPGWFDGGWWYPPVDKPGGGPGAYKRLLQCVVDPDDPELQRCTYGIWVTEVPAAALAGGFTIIDTPAAGITFGGIVEASLGFECTQPGGPGTEVKCSFSGGVKAEAWLGGYVFLGLEMLVPRQQIIQTNYAVLDNCVKVDLAGNVIGACTGVKDEPPVLKPEKEFVGCEQVDDALQCKVRLRVTNPGPVDYLGPLHLEDVVGPGVGFVPPAVSEPAVDGWTCAQPGGPGTFISCDTAGNVLLPAGTSSGVLITLQLPADADEAARKDCVRLADGGEEVCITIPDKPRLTLDKKFDNCEPHGAGYICTYEITITNVGAGTYTGPLNVTDNVGPDTAYFMHAPNPPWTCNQAAIGAPIACANPGPVTLAPGASTTLTLRVSIPGEKVDENSRDCAIMEHDGKELRDCATIDEKKPKLVPEKESLRCIKREPGDDKAICTFRLTVRNTGDAPYTGIVSVSDIVGPGVAYVDHAPAADWTCIQPGGAGNQIDCNTNAPVTLNPGDSAFVDIRVTVPVNQSESHTDCAIVEGNDETACVTVRLGKPRLKTEKDDTTCERRGDNYLCTWTIRVTNVGAAPFSGGITVGDVLPVPGATLLAPVGGSIPWTCTVAGGGAAFRCDGNATLAPGASVTLQPTFSLPLGIEGQVDVRNCAVGGPTSALPMSLRRKQGKGGGAALLPFMSAQKRGGSGGANLCERIRDRLPEGFSCDCGDGKLPPAPPPPPPPTGKPKLERTKTLEGCRIEGETLKCMFYIHVRNVGAAPYNGTITVRDLPAGGGWKALHQPGASAWDCRQPGGAGTPVDCATKVPQTLAPGETFDAVVPLEMERPAEVSPGERLVNCVQKYDSGDERSCVTVQPPQPEWDKKLKECRRADGSIVCTFTFFMRNTGAGPYVGEGRFVDIPVTGALAGSNPPAGWSCTQENISGIGNVISCNSSGDVTIPPGGAISGELTVRYPDDGKEHVNCWNPYYLDDTRKCIPVEVPPDRQDVCPRGTQTFSSANNLPPGFRVVKELKDGRVCARYQAMPTPVPVPAPVPPKPGHFTPPPTPKPGPKCRRGERQVPSRAYAQKRGWPVRRVVRGGKAIWCAVPRELPRPQCPAGWRQVPRAELGIYKERGWPIRQVGRGKAAIWCVKPTVPPRPQCPAGWQQVPSRAYAQQRGWPVRFIRVPGGPATMRGIWCAKPVVRPQCPKGTRLFPNPNTVPRGYRVVRKLRNGAVCARPVEQTPVLQCPKGMKQLSREQYRAYRKRGWPTSIVRRGDRVLFCGRQGEVGPVCPKGWQQVSPNRLAELRRRGWKIIRGKRGAWCGKPGRVVDPVREICRPPAFRRGKGCACPKGYKPRTVTTGRARITSCVRVQPPRCPKGQVRRGGRCVPVVRPCPPGFVRKAGKCVRRDVVRPCPKGQVRRGDRCVPVVRPCPQGTKRVRGQCVPVVRPCPPGFVRKAGRCVRRDVVRPCPKGTVRKGRACVPVRPQRPRPRIDLTKPPRQCRKGFVLRKGKCVPVRRTQPRKCPKGTVPTRQGRCIPLRTDRLLRDAPRVVRPCPKGQVRHNGVCGPRLQ